MIELDDYQLSLLTQEQRDTYWMDRAAERAKAKKAADEIAAKQAYETKVAELKAEQERVVNGKGWSEDSQRSAIVDLLQKQNELARQRENELGRFRS